MIRKCKSNKDLNIRDTVRYNISSINNGGMPWLKKRSSYVAQWFSMIMMNTIQRIIVSTASYKTRTKVVHKSVS